MYFVSFLVNVAVLAVSTRMVLVFGDCWVWF